MKLKKLLKDIPVKDVKGLKDVEITGICGHSKFIAPGNLFVAKKGLTVDGARFVPEAVAAGAAAVVTDIYDPTLKNTTQIIHPNPEQIEGLIAAQYHQQPSKDLFMVAITGTNGKTTTSFLIKHILDKVKGPCGVIGTIEYMLGTRQYQATRTTPDVTMNHKLLHEMVQQGCRSAVMEVSSHGLDQGRVNNIDFDVAIFTNLTPDHLDYHKTMEDYCAAKNRLFRSLDPTKKAIVNVDSPWARKIIEGCRAEVFTYGIDNKADLQAKEIHLTPTGTHLKLAYQDKLTECFFPLIGRYNVYNCLAALAVGLPFDGQITETFSQVPGRLELVPNSKRLKIYVDFAHSEDALKNVLTCLHELKRDRIITVFGCGGERDRLKRPMMARASETLSDMTIVTSDNPRSEEPESIIQEIVKGFQNKESYLVEVDRRKAIKRAIDMATADDIILIAGRGHEHYQIFAHYTVEFDDRKVAAEMAFPKSEVK